VSETKARQAGLKSAAESALTTYLSPQNGSSYDIQAHVEQAAVIYVSSENPALGAALGVLFGNGFNADLPQALAVEAFQYEAEHYLAEWAAERGITLQELNILLGLNSKLGLWLAGTTYDEEKNSIEGFFSRKDGVLGRAGAGVGVIWDLNDSLLNVQGLLDAVAQTVKSNTELVLVGHSLGAWRANNLVQAGVIAGAFLESLPLLAYPMPGTAGLCISSDIICGGAFVTAIRPNTTLIPSPGGLTHGKEYYENYELTIYGY
jgi:hypothetical protein